MRVEAACDAARVLEPTEVINFYMLSDNCLRVMVSYFLFKVIKKISTNESKIILGLSSTASRQI